MTLNPNDWKNENIKNSDATYEPEFKWIKLFNGIRAL